jgi:hypothetical protein
MKKAIIELIKKLTNNVEKDMKKQVIELIKKSEHYKNWDKLSDSQKYEIIEKAEKVLKADPKVVKEGKAFENETKDVIGKTKSGKWIHAKADHPAHKKFTREDHKDAIQIHQDAQIRDKEFHGDHIGYHGVMARGEQPEPLMKKSEDLYKGNAEALGHKFESLSDGKIKISGPKVNELFSQHTESKNHPIEGAISRVKFVTSGNDLEKAIPQSTPEYHMAQAKHHFDTAAGSSDVNIVAHHSNESNKHLKLAGHDMDKWEAKRKDLGDKRYEAGEAHLKPYRKNEVETKEQENESHAKFMNAAKEYNEHRKTHPLYESSMKKSEAFELIESLEKATDKVQIGQTKSGAPVHQSKEVHEAISSGKGEHGIGHPLPHTTESKELELYADNNKPSYDTKMGAFHTLAKRKINRGDTFNNHLAHKLLRNVSKTHGEHYTKEFSSPNDKASNVFSSKDHDINAHHMLHEFHDKMKEGEFNHLKTKKTLKEEKK